MGKTRIYYINQNINNRTSNEEHIRRVKDKLEELLNLDNRYTNNILNLNSMTDEEFKNES